MPIEGVSADWRLIEIGHWEGQASSLPSWQPVRNGFEVQGKTQGTGEDLLLLRIIPTDGGLLFDASPKVNVSQIKDCLRSLSWLKVQNQGGHAVIVITQPFRAKAPLAKNGEKFHGKAIVPNLLGNFLVDYEDKLKYPKSVTDKFGKDAELLVQIQSYRLTFDIKYAAQSSSSPEEQAFQKARDDLKQAEIALKQAESDIDTSERKLLDVANSWESSRKRTSTSSNSTRSSPAMELASAMEALKLTLQKSEALKQLSNYRTDSKWQEARLRLLDEFEKQIPELRTAVGEAEQAVRRRINASSLKYRKEYETPRKTLIAARKRFSQTEHEIKRLQIEFKKASKLQDEALAKREMTLGQFSTTIEFKFNDQTVADFTLHNVNSDLP